MQPPYERLQLVRVPRLIVNHVLSLLCALAMLAGAVAFARHDGDRVSFVELGAAVRPHASATLPA